MSVYYLYYHQYENEAVFNNFKNRIKQIDHSLHVSRIGTGHHIYTLLPFKAFLCLVVGAGWQYPDNVNTCWCDCPINHHQRVDGLDAIRRYIILE